MPPITADCYLPDGLNTIEFLSHILLLTVVTFILYSGSVVDDAGTNPTRVLAKVVQGSTPIIGAKVTYVINIII